MNKELLEEGVDVQHVPEKTTYQRYLELGGTLSKDDYNNAFHVSEGKTESRESIRLQAENIAKDAGIELHGPSDSRIVLYRLLNGKMTDHRLFREVLRMLDDTDALAKLKAKYHTNRLLGTYCPLCQQTRYSEDCP